MNPIVGIVTSTQSCNDISYYPCVVLQIEVMFEKYNFGAVFIQIQAVLTLYAQGKLYSVAYIGMWACTLEYKTKVVMPLDVNSL